MTPLGPRSRRIATSVVGGSALVPSNTFTITVSGTPPTFNPPPPGDPTWIPPGGQEIEEVDTSGGSFDIEGEPQGPYPVNAIGSTVVEWIITFRCTAVGGADCPIPSNVSFQIGIRTSGGGLGSSLTQTGSGSGNCVGTGGTTSVAGGVIVVTQATLLSTAQWREFRHVVRFPRDGRTWWPFMVATVTTPSTSLGMTVTYHVLP
jgi:hypothetical protein